jgi:hypothetical protein
MINVMVTETKDLSAIESAELVHLLDAARSYDGRGEEFEMERQRIRLLAGRLGVTVEYR